MNNTTNTNTVSPALHLLAPQIAAALPGAWVANPISPESPARCNFYLVRSDGLTIFLAGSSGGWAAKGRLTMTYSSPKNGGKYMAIYEKGTGKTVQSPGISVADSKTPEKIAADIVARILPEAERIDALARAQITGAQNYEMRMLTFYKSVFAASGNAEGYDGKPNFAFDLPEVDGSSVEIQTADTAKIEIYADGARALALIAFLRSPAYLTAGAV